MSFASNAEAGARLMRGFLDTYEQARQRKEFEDIQNAKETPIAATMRDATAGEVGRAQAEAQKLADQDSQEFGAPVEPVMPARNEGQESYRVMSSPAGFSFLGKTYDKPLTDDQRSMAKTMAMADVVGKTNPIEGFRLRQSVEASERDRQRFANEQRVAGRQARLDQQTDDKKAALDQVSNDVGKWFETKLTNPDGTKRAATVDDHMEAGQRRASMLFSKGLVDEAGQVLKDHQAQSLIKIQLQSAERDQALGKAATALASGDFGPVREFYNTFVPDGAKVTNITKNDKGEITIERQRLDGAPLPPQTLKDSGQLLAGLNSLKDPLSLYNWSQNEFANNLKTRHMDNEEARAKAAEKTAAAAEANAATNARKLDLLLMGGGMRGAAGGAGQGSGQSSVSIEDQRKFNQDFQTLLPKVDALDPAQAATAHAANNSRLAQAQAVFQTNLAVGKVLTAPEVMAAQEMAKDPAKVQVVGYKDAAGTVVPVQVVTVNGKTIIVGTAKADGASKPGAPASPGAAGQTNTPPSTLGAAKPSSPMANFMVTDPGGADLPGLMLDAAGPASGDPYKPGKYRPGSMSNVFTVN